MTREAPNLNAFTTARARYEQEELAAAVATGATQYVVLGAGPDADAARMIDPRLRVFAVSDRAIEDQPLGSALESAGFKTQEISFFSWFGATLHRTAEAVVETLAFIGSLPTGSGVVFAYAVERSSLDSMKEMALDALASRIGKAGEPFRLFLSPSALYGLLRAAGFRRIEDLSPDEIDSRYSGGSAAGSSLGAGAAHLVNARV